MDVLGEGVDHITMEVDDYDNTMSNLKLDKSSGNFQDPDGVKLLLKKASN